MVWSLSWSCELRWLKDKQQHRGNWNKLFPRRWGGITYTVCLSSFCSTDYRGSKQSIPEEKGTIWWSLSLLLSLCLFTVCRPNHFSSEDQIIAYSIYLPIHLFLCPFLCVYIPPSIHSSLHSPIHPSTHPIIVISMIYLQCPLIGILTELVERYNIISVTNSNSHLDMPLLSETDRGNGSDGGNNTDGGNVIARRLAAIIGKSFRVSVDFMRLDERRSQSQFCTFSFNFPLFRCYAGHIVLLTTWCNFFICDVKRLDLWKNTGSSTVSDERF